MLYAYPLLDTVEKDYDEHILNRAVLSYHKNAQETAEYIVGEIWEKDWLVWLKSVVEGVLDKLSEVEKALVSVRYFGKKRKIKGDLTQSDCEEYLKWSESKYFREQQKLGEKLEAKLKSAGLNKALFEKVFAPTDMFATLYKYLCEGKGEKLEKMGKRACKGLKQVHSKSAEKSYSSVS